MKKSKIEQLFSEYLIRKFESESTIRTYFSCGRGFIYDSHPDSIDKMSDEYISKYLTDIRIDSVSRYNQTLSALKHLYNGVLNQKRKLINVKPIKQHPQLVKLPTFDYCSNCVSLVTNIKHKAILLMLLTTGLRISELLNVKISDVDSKNMKITVNKGKGGCSRFVVMTESLLLTLREYYKAHKPLTYLFEGSGGKYSKTSVVKIVKKHIGEKYSPHWLRKVAITHIINNNIPMPKAKIFSGHKSDSSIGYYYSYSNETLDELRSIMEI